MRESRVPMLKHLDGICHVYIDGAADIGKAIAIADNAKTQRYGTCNTMETLLVAQSIAPQRVACSWAASTGRKVSSCAGCPESRAILERSRDRRSGRRLVDADWRTEYLAPILSISTLPGIDAAIAHINTFGSQAHRRDRHRELLDTRCDSCARSIQRRSSSMLRRAFADGYEYGLGAEIGISNDKLHARGPVGLEGLTSLKYVVFGNGEVRTG